MAEHRGGSGNFAEDRDKASDAGRKGGQQSGGNFKTTRNAPLKQVRKGGRIVMAEAVVLTNPDLNYVSLNT